MNMKLSALGTALGLALAAGAAQASPYIPPGNTPLFIKFGNAEQICLSGNCITPPSGSAAGAPPPPVVAAEQNWGILNVTTIFPGGPIPPNQLFNQTALPLWQTISGTGSGNSGQITGIFYGIQAAAPSLANPIRSTSGFVDLWFDELPANGGTLADLSTAVPSGRTGVNAFTNFTDGTFLARLAFAPGIDPGGDPTVNIIGSVNPSDVAGGLTGFADSYADVVDTNGDGVINGADGLWAGLLNGNFFNVLVDHGAGLVPEKRDFRFKNSYNVRADWNGAGIVGANSDDPARAFSVPEPTTVALLGLGLAGLGLRKRKQAKA